MLIIDGDEYVACTRLSLSHGAKLPVGRRLADHGRSLNDSLGRRNLFVDLGAEKLIGAEREGKRIAVEVKRFQSSSEVHDLEQALGQCFLYAPFLHAQEPERLLYLAIPLNAYTGIFDEPLGKSVLANYSFRLWVIDEDKETIFLWIPEP